MQQTIQYLFIIALVLIVVAYFAGSTQVLSTAFGGASNLFRSSVGENTAGTAFLGYAK